MWNKMTLRDFFMDNLSQDLLKYILTEERLGIYPFQGKCFLFVRSPQCFDDGLLIGWENVLWIMLIFLKNPVNNQKGFWNPWLQERFLLEIWFLFFKYWIYLPALCGRLLRVWKSGETQLSDSQPLKHNLLHSWWAEKLQGSSYSRLRFLIFAALQQFRTPWSLVL